MKDNLWRDALTALGVATLGSFFLAILIAANIGPLSSSRLGPPERDCSVSLMCQDENDDGVCQDSTDTDNVHLNATGKYAYTFYGTQSASTDYTCDVYSNETGYTGTAALKQKINSVSMTEDNQIISLEGLFYYVWVECTTTDDDVDVTMLSCPL